MFDLNSLRSDVFRVLPTGASEAARTRAKLFLEESVVDAGRFGRVEFDEAAFWLDTSDRARGRYFHGLLFIADWFTTIKEDPSGRFGRVALKVVRAWVDMHPTIEPHSDSMAYHDETTAQRLNMLILLENAVEAKADDSTMAWIHDLMDQTARILADEDFHSGGNNHGMFQDQALRNYSLIAYWQNDLIREEFFALACVRLKAYFDLCFTPEGVHIENSPTYHMIICRSIDEHLNIISKIQHSDAKNLSILLKRAGEYAKHIVMPNGRFPQISDTQQGVLHGQSGKIFKDSEFDFAVTAGASGVEPLERVLVLPESGYAIYRSAWGDPDASYILFSAAYHADYHKHSDDLSLLIRSRGLELISEAGPYGYNYKDPLTVYGYSQFAHNNVVINGKSIRRTDGNGDSVRFIDGRARADGFIAKAVTGRLVDVNHTRQVEVLEEHGSPVTEVLDQFESQSNQRYEMFWNIGPGIEVVAHGQGFELYKAGEKVLDAILQSNVSTRLSVHRGEMSPRVLGWRFPEFGKAVPTNVVRVQFTGRRPRVSTVFKLKDFSYTDRRLNEASNGWERFEGRVGLNYLLTTAKSEADKKMLVVAFSAISKIGDFSYNYKKTLDEIDANVLYVLDDFGDQGSYYLQDHSTRSIFSSVQDLISSICERLGVSRDRVAMIGSSKGGSSALMHGAAFGAGHIFVGAPQTMIGNFIKKPHPNILSFMTGGNSDDDIEKLNNSFFEIMGEVKASTKINLVVGSDDHHYRDHALPLQKHLTALGRELTLTVLPGTPHSEIGPAFRELLSGYLSSLSSASAELPPTPVARAVYEQKTKTMTVIALGSSQVVSAFHLYNGRELTIRGNYSAAPTSAWKDLPPGRYRVRVFQKFRGGREASKSTTSWVTID